MLCHWYPASAYLHFLFLIVVLLDISQLMQIMLNTFKFKVYFFKKEFSVQNPLTESGYFGTMFLTLFKREVINITTTINKSVTYPKHQAARKQLTTKHFS